MKRVKGWLGKNWPLALAVLASFGFISFLYSFQLNSLTNGFSRVEADYITQNSYIQNVAKEPVFLLHKLLSYAASSISSTANFGRLPSVLLFVPIIGCFYILMGRWYTRRVALLTTLLFTTSSWSLVIGRQALPTVMYLCWLPLLCLMYWAVSKGKLSLLLWGLSFGLALYIPGMLWFVIVLAISQRKRLESMAIRAAAWQLISAIALCVLVALPYVFALFHSPSTAISALGLPTTISQITSFPSRLYQIVLQIFIYSGANPVFRLGHLPYLDITTVFLFLVGLYRLRFSQSRKMVTWSGIIALGWIIGAGLGAINIAIFLPLIYIIVGGGISFLLVQWFKVFPRNPVARGFAVAIVSGLIVLISFYHLMRYFIAWPMNPATREVFSVKIDE